MLGVISTLVALLIAASAWRSRPKSISHRSHPGRAGRARPSPPSRRWSPLHLHPSRTRSSGSKMRDATHS
jgi:hypothetical protein